MFSNRSPYRNATGKKKKDGVYNFDIATKPHETSHGISASHQWIATGYGGNGSIAVLPVDSSQYSPKTIPTISAHSQNPTDFSFSPFHHDLLATGASDGIVKLWSIPQEGITSCLSVPASTVELGTDIFSMKFNPCADNIMAVGTKQGVVILDLEKGEGQGAEGGSIQIVGWNYDGSLLAVGAKSGQLSVFDPRAELEGVLETGTKLNVRKMQHVLFMTQEGNGIGTFGLFSLSTGLKPTLELFDSRNVSKPKAKIQIGLNNGFSLPLYDYDTSILYTNIRSSSTIALYDFSKIGDGTFPSQPQSQFACENAIRGCCLAPKSVCTLSQNEIARLYTLTQKSIETYCVTVPRKVKAFDPSLFPDTIDTSEMTLSADEWLKGGTKAPNLVNIQTLVSKLNKACGLEVKEEKKDVKTHLPKSVLKKQKLEEEKKITSKQVEYVQTKSRTRLNTKFKSSIFTHLSGSQPTQPEKTWYQLRLGKPLLFQRNIQCNSLYWGIPWGQTGSCIRIQPFATKGRASENPPVVDAQTDVTCFDLSRLQQNLLATGSGSGIAKVFTIPDGGIKKTLTEGMELEHKGKITVVKFHPQIDDVLLVATSNFETENHVVNVWDLKEEYIRSFVGEKIHGNSVLGIAFDNDANLIATTCKDSYARIFCPRTGELMKEFKVKQSVKDTTPFFVSSTRLLIVGYDSGSSFSASLWDFAKKPQSLGTATIANGNYTPVSHYDQDTHILFVAQVGGRSVNTLEINEKSPYIEKLSVWKSDMGDFVGHCFRPKMDGDVMKIEVNLSLQLQKKKVIPITWRVPRKRKEFFQDDLFPPTVDCRSRATVNEWFDSEGNMEAKYINLQPKDTVKLSNAPEEEKTERQKKYEDQLRKQEEAKRTDQPKGATGHTDAAAVKSHFQAISQTMPTRNKWDAVVDDVDEVDEDEWDD